MSTTTRPLPLLTLSALAVALACAGCPGNLENAWQWTTEGGASDADVEAGAPEIDGGCGDVPSTIFVPLCGMAGCHSTADKTQSLDLQAPDPASRLVGKCAVGGGILVDPQHPTQSVLYEKMTLTPPFGSRMPLGGTPLTDAQMACVVAWISAQTGTAGSCTPDAASPPPDAGTQLDAGKDASDAAGD